MKYNFDEPVDRSKNRSAKYDERVKNFGTDDVIPLSRQRSLLLMHVKRKRKKESGVIHPAQIVILKRMPTGS